ncbi:MAG: adenylosuccinate synthase [Bacillota bacterium]
MSTLVIVGTHWGDEGKGKITNYLSADADVVVRYQGGANAGHTVVIGDKVYKLRLIPSGIFFPEKLCIIGNGVVVDPETLVEELDYLLGKGIDPSNLRVSSSAHLVMPYHIQLDVAEEERRGPNKIGTTLRGIGPAYMDKFARLGLRMADLIRPESFIAKLRRNLVEKNYLLERVYGVKGFELEEIAERYLGFAERLRPYIADTSLLINQAIDRGDKVLFEGAQGTLLDIDFGTYPYVTSSHPIAGGACVGAGVGPTRIDRVLGVVKAYTSRVGEGPFPTELFGEMGDWLRERGDEYGTVTRRPRRVGWLDAVILRYSARVSGLTHLAVTRVDTLSELESVKVAVAYEYRGQIIKDLPTDPETMAECRPVYEELPGWGPIRGSQVQPALQAYLDLIRRVTGVPVAMASIGQERTQTIMFEELF